MASAMNGLDAIVFTGGAGENSAEIRQRAMGGLGFRGIVAEPDANAAGTGDREIGEATAQVRAFVVGAREDIAIAHQVRDTLAASGA
jgi:acetate kinase